MHSWCVFTPCWTNLTKDRFLICNCNFVQHGKNVTKVWPNSANANYTSLHAHLHLNLDQFRHSVINLKIHFRFFLTLSATSDPGTFVSTQRGEVFDVDVLQLIIWIKKIIQTDYFFGLICFEECCFKSFKLLSYFLFIFDFAFACTT